MEQKKKEKILALILLLYPLRHFRTGLDLMDAGYALGNYRFYDTMNETWKIATYLSNVVGRLLSFLPFGNTWIGMNIYTSLLIGATAAVTYLFMVNLQPEDDKKEYILFVAELMAISLCWAPSTILYHYLGYILMTMATCMLYTAITKDNTKYYIGAGIILGLCVAVRMPNITYMAFILPVWYYCFINRKSEEKWFGRLVSRTLYCIGGYLVGVIIPVGYIEVRYGLNAYPDMISSLFGMTDTATDYKPTSMITSMFGDYISYGVWLLAFVIYAVIGIIFFKMMAKILEKQMLIFKILYGIGFLVVLRFGYGRGMFGLDFTDNFSMYKWLVVYLLGVIIFSIVAIISDKIDNTLKLWSVFVLVTIFITPLGSNNGLYPIINNLFVVAPISIILVLEICKQFVNKLKGETQFVIKYMITSVMICFFVVSLLYGINYVFHDYLGAGDKRVSISLKSDSTANGLLTTSDKAETLEGLDDFLYENNLTEKDLITYGDIPALSYIFNMKPAIYTTWGDLDSNPIGGIEADLNRFDGENKNTEELPIVILGTESIKDLTDESALAYKKYILIEEFIADNNYTKVYENESYAVYQVCADQLQ